MESETENEFPGRAEFIVLDPPVRLHPTSTSQLNGTEGTYVKSITFMDKHKLIVAACSDNKVRIYDIETNGESKGIFSRHHGEIVQVIQLCEDFVASVERDGYVFTWEAATTLIVGALNLGELGIGNVSSMERLSDAKLVIGTLDGHLCVVSHCFGSNMFLDDKILNVHKGSEEFDNGVNSIAAHGDIFVTMSAGDFRSKVWSSITHRQIHSLSHRSKVGTIAIDSNFILTGCINGDICVRQNSRGYPLTKILWTRCTEMHSISILNHKVLSFVGGGVSRNCISFISLQRQAFLGQVEFNPADTHDLSSSVVLGDGRLAVAGDICTLFSPPYEVHSAVEDFIAENYPHSAVAQYTGTALNCKKSVGSEVNGGFDLESLCIEIEKKLRPKLTDEIRAELENEFNSKMERVLSELDKLKSKID